MLRGAFFDLDGVIIDTERDGHRVAFNQAFSDFGIPDAVWDQELYHHLLQIGGGKERIRYYFTSCYRGRSRRMIWIPLYGRYTAARRTFFSTYCPSCLCGLAYGDLCPNCVT